MKTLFSKKSQPKAIWLEKPIFGFEQPFLPNNTCVAYDIEVYKNYFCCVVIGPKNEPKVFQLDDLQDMCKTLTDKRLIMVGFNNLWYDDYIMKYIFLDQRQQLSSNLRDAFGEGNLITRLRDLSDAIITMKNNDRPQWYWDLWREDVPWNFSMDIFQIPKPELGLKERSCERHTLSIEESPIPFDAVVTEEDIDDINNYCINDVRDTIIEWNLGIKHVHLRQKLKELYPHSDIITKHNAGICEEILTKEYLNRVNLDKKYLKGKISRPGKKIMIKECIPPWTKYDSEFLQDNLDRLALIAGKFSSDTDRACLNHVVDFKNQKILTDPELFDEDEEGEPLSKTIKNWTKEQGFAVTIKAGGLHSIDWPLVLEPGENELLFEVDVRSFYPGLIRAMQLKPEHMGEEFNNILNGIVDMRLDAKGKKDYLVSEGLKIVINSAFGKTGSQYSMLFDERMQLQVTLGGQLSLLMLIEQLLKRNINIISANTDGIVILIPKAKKFIVDTICKKWEKITGQTLEETQYKKYVRRDVNNYLVVKKDGSTKEKGIFRIRKPEKDIRKQRNKAEILADALRDYFMNGVEPAEHVMACSDLRKFIYSFHVSMSWSMHQKLMVDGQIQKVPILKTSRWYTSKEMIRDKRKGYFPSERVGDVYKVGPMTEKEKKKYKDKHKTDKHPNDWYKEIKVENGENSVIINKLPKKFPEDLDFIHYIIAVKKRIKEIEG